jgi:hypothetical protein
MIFAGKSKEEAMSDYITKVRRQLPQAPLKFGPTSYYWLKPVCYLITRTIFVLSTGDVNHVPS